MELGGVRWRELPPGHRRWIAHNALAATALVNAVVNGLLAWLSASGSAQVPLWSIPVLGRPSTITDTVGTLFFLPFFTSLLCTTAVWRELRLGRLEPLGRRSSRLRSHRADGRLRRGLRMGGLCTALLGPVAIVALVGAGFGDISRGEFVIYKIIFGVVFGALVTPVVAVRAMTDREPALVAS